MINLYITITLKCIHPILKPVTDSKSGHDVYVPNMYIIVFHLDDNPAEFYVETKPVSCV